MFATTSQFTPFGPARMIHLSSIPVILLLCSFGLESTVAWQQPLQRRAFLVQSSAATIFGLPLVANAYERRDVGGPERSPDQAAYNDQAYETNNRLEREGLKLETAEEQKASLTAALSEYNYSATPDKQRKNDTKKKNKKE